MIDGGPDRGDCGRGGAGGLREPGETGGLGGGAGTRLVRGLVLRGVGGAYRVRTEGGAVHECYARGLFRKGGVTPLPGDLVEVAPPGGSVGREGAGRGVIRGILPRSSVMARPAVANVDQVVIVISPSSPQPDFLLVDKVLISARVLGIAAVLCVNKSDLDRSGFIGSVASEYAKAEVGVVGVSARTGEGMDGLVALMEGRKSVLAGQSGVGKSSILNGAVGAERMETGGLSEKAVRGRHTTRHAELVELLGGGYLVDTPGFSLYEPDGFESGGLGALYPEFAPYLGRCRFAGCAHVAEPDCMVKEAVGRGEVSARRHEGYIRAYKEAKDRERSRWR